MPLTQSRSVPGSKKRSPVRLNDLLFCARRCAMHRIEQVWVDKPLPWRNQRIGGRIGDRGGAAPVFAPRMRCCSVRALCADGKGRRDRVSHCSYNGLANPSYKVAPRPLIRSSISAAGAALGQRRRAALRQALCLEEMLACPCGPGRSNHISPGERREIVFTAALRAQPKTTARVCTSWWRRSNAAASVLKPRCGDAPARPVYPELLEPGGPDTRLSACAVWSA